jgi:hypothetical protein
MAFILAVCLLGAASAGIYVNAISPFWFDEVFTAGMSCQPTLADTLRLTAHDYHPVLYHTMIHGLFRIAGCDPWAVRGLSIACSLAGAGVLVSAVRRMHGDWMLAAALLLGSPAFWEEAFEGRSYALLFLAGCGVVSFELSGNPVTRLWAIAFALFGGLLHYFAGYLMPVVLFLEIGIYGMPRRRSFLVMFAIASGILALYYAVQLTNVLHTGTSMPWLHAPTFGQLFPGLTEYYFGSIQSLLCISVIGAIVLYAQYISGTVSDRAATCVMGSFLFFAIALFLVSQFNPAYLYHYLFHVAALAAPVALWTGRAETALAEGPSAQGRLFQQVIFISMLMVLLLNAVHIMASSGASGASHGIGRGLP